MDLHLLILRLLHSTGPGVTLATLLLLLALLLLVQQLLLRRSPTLAEMNVVALRGGLLALPLILGGASLAARLGYPSDSARGENLRIAGAAPVRVAYGAAAGPVLQVFTAPGCGPCRALEGRLKALVRDGYTVQYIPVPMIDEQMEELSQALCGPDPKPGFERMFGLADAAPGQEPPATPCLSPVEQNEAALQELSGRLVFPTLVLPDGLLWVGAPSDAELRDYLGAAGFAPAPSPAGRAL